MDLAFLVGRTSATCTANPLLCIDEKCGFQIRVTVAIQHMGVVPVGAKGCDGIFEASVLIEESGPVTDTGLENHIERPINSRLRNPGNVACDVQTAVFDTSRGVRSVIESREQRVLFLFPVVYPFFACWVGFLEIAAVVCVLSEIFQCLLS